MGYSGCAVAKTVVLVGVSAVVACVRPGDVDLGGKACPCGGGWYCDTSRNVCVSEPPPQRFIRTYYAGLGGRQIKLTEIPALSRYDMVVYRRFQDGKGDIRRDLKKANPNIEIYLRQMGRVTETDNETTAPLNSIKRWTREIRPPTGLLRGTPCSLTAGSTHVSDKFDPNTALLDLGLPTCQQFWTTATITDMVGNAVSADGVYIERMRPRLDEILPGRPAKYPTDTSWSDAVVGFLSHVTPTLRAKGQKVWTERGNVNEDAALAKTAWTALDASAGAPDVVEENLAFVIQYPGDRPFQVLPESTWLAQVNLMGQVSRSRVAVYAHTQLKPGETRIDPVSQVAASFHDVLWFAMASYHLGKNDALGTSYFSFTGSEDHVIWHREYDAINLGRAVKNTSPPYEVVDQGAARVYFREFDKGTVFVNPTRETFRDLPLRESGKRLSPSNLDASTIASENKLTLEGYRGAFVVKASAASR